MQKIGKKVEMKLMHCKEQGQNVGIRTRTDRSGRPVGRPVGRTESDQGRVVSVSGTEASVGTSRGHTFTKGRTGRTDRSDQPVLHLQKTASVQNRGCDILPTSFPQCSHGKARPVGPTGRMPQKCLDSLMIEAVARPVRCS